MTKQIKIIGVRQGDLAFIKIAKLPMGLKAVKTNVLLQNGSGGNPHTFKGGIFYPKIDGQFIIGYLKAKNTKLYHSEHGNKNGEKLLVGVWEVRRQSEDTIQGLKVVVD